MSIEQTAFANALLNPSKPVPDGLVDPQGRPAGKRFDVYRNNVVFSLLEAMQTAFPAIEKLLGATLFREISIDFIRQHPPSTPILMFYGAGFAEFLQGLEPLAAYPFLADIARLELLRRESYHAADAAAIQPAALAAIPPERLVALHFDFAPGMRLLTSDFPIVGIWEYNMAANAPKPAQEPQTALISRPEFDPVLTSIPAQTGRFISLMQQGECLGAAFDTIATQTPDFDLGTALGLMLQTKIITKINL